MWNPGRNPVPQVFIDVLLDEEADDMVIDENHGELVEEFYDANDILNLPMCFERPDGSLGDLSELLKSSVTVSAEVSDLPSEPAPGPAPRGVEVSNIMPVTLQERILDFFALNPEESTRWAAWFLRCFSLENLENSTH